MLDNPKTIWTLLAELAKHQEDLGSMATSERAKRMMRVLRNQFFPISHQLLEKATESELSPFLSSYLHLPPDQKGGQPVLRASFEEKDGHRVFRIRAAIFVEAEDEHYQKVHRGIGIRFESPEGPTGSSNHDYYHAQWFCSFEKGFSRLPGCPPWLPDVHPAIPVRAENAVDILCCALKSFYGSRNSEPLQWLAERARGDRAMAQETRERIRRWVGMV